jgi:hypothetical protein
MNILSIRRMVFATQVVVLTVLTGCTDEERVERSASAVTRTRTLSLALGNSGRIGVFGQEGPVPSALPLATHSDEPGSAMPSGIPVIPSPPMIDSPKIEEVEGKMRAMDARLTKVEGDVTGLAERQEEQARQGQQRHEETRKEFAKVHDHIDSVQAAGSRVSTHVVAKPPLPEERPIGTQPPQTTAVARAQTAWGWVQCPRCGRLYWQPQYR